MMYKLSFCVILLLFIAASCSTPSAEDTAETLEEATAALLFEPGVLSTELPEFATSTNDDWLFFNRTTADRSSMRILYFKKEGDQWGSLDTLAFSEGKYVDVDPFLSYDGQRVYFSSNRPVNPTDTLPGEFNTWYTDRVGDTWSSPILSPPPLNSDSSEIFVSFARNGNAYFRSHREGRNLMKSVFKDGEYQKAEVINLTFQGAILERTGNPCIAADESYIIVAASNPEHNGAADLWLSWKEEDEWSELINLGPLVNSEYTEFAPGLSKDGEILYFTSERPGIVPAQEEGVRPPGDIYWV